MSRSYRKTPIVKDNKRGRKIAKRRANKRMRKKLDIHNGKAYRKVTNPWDIYDYVFRWSKEDAINFYNNDLQADKYWKKYYPTLEDFLEKGWARDFKYK
jgi:hypothetical protein